MEISASRILIVEDERIIAEDIRSILGKFGYDAVDIVPTGEEAVAFAEAARPALVLMDIMLAGEMDGIEAAGRIHSELCIPVIYLTAHADDDTVRRATCTEPAGYVIKPVQECELNTAIQLALYKACMERTLRESEEKYRGILESIQEAYFEVDLEGNLLFFNRALREVLDLPEEQIKGCNYREYVAADTVKKAKDIFRELLKTGESSRTSDFELVRKDGSVLVFEVSTALMRGGDGEVMGFRGVARDVTERKLMEKTLAYLATHDSLTSLPNRLLFMDRLKVEIIRSRRNRQKLAVVMLDLDGFKIANDTYGHAMGDRILRACGLRLSDLLRKSDTVARLGGDEFMILLSEVSDSSHIAAIAEKILQEIRQPFDIEGEVISLSTSVGGVIYPDDGDDAETLIKRADIAMYAAKARGRDNYQAYGHDLEEWIFSPERQVRR